MMRSLTVRQAALPARDADEGGVASEFEFRTVSGTRCVVSRPEGQGARRAIGGFGKRRMPRQWWPTRTAADGSLEIP